MYGGVPIRGPKSPRNRLELPSCRPEQECGEGNQTEGQHGECSAFSKEVPECTAFVTPLTGIFKVPVALGNVTVQVDTEAEITLPEPAQEIKRITKTVFINQCELLLTNPGGTLTLPAGAPTSKLFLKGFIEKNIEFSTANRFGRYCTSGEIKDVNVRVPFQCVAATPGFTFTEIPTTVNEFEFLDRKRTDFSESKFFNERPFCELVSAQFSEADFTKFREFRRFEDGTFRTFREKLILYVTVTVLQNRLVSLT